jgi:hypothetical protein
MTGVPETGRGDTALVNDERRFLLERVGEAAVVQVYPCDLEQQMLEYSAFARHGAGGP